MIKEAIKTISSQFLDAKTESLTGHTLANYIRGCSKKIIKPLVGDEFGRFTFRSSPGLHQTWADVPWIAVMNPEVTTTTQYGYYVVYLFSVDMQRVCLSLNQGITNLVDELGQKKVVRELERRASFIRDRTPEYKATFSDNSINLASHLSKSHRPKLYEHGHAFGIEYTVSNLPAEEILISDLKSLLTLYLVLSDRGGLDSDLTGYDFKPENLDKQSIEERKKYRRHRSIERNLRTAKEVKKKRGYTCEVCGFNFKEKYGELSLNEKGECYIEAHHLTPLSELKEGESVIYDIDHDFCVVCSNCHRMLHKKNPPYTIKELKLAITPKTKH